MISKEKESMDASSELVIADVGAVSCSDLSFDFFPDSSPIIIVLF